MAEATIDTVQVALKIRPLMQEEVKKGCEECINSVDGEPQVQIKQLAFTYNYVFPQHITQQEFYDTAVKGLIGKLFEGYNVTILAYGQTGSGKTYTMGTNYSDSDGDSTNRGVIPLAVTDIFEFIEANKDKFEFKMIVSFIELYQEQCIDLLSGKTREHSIIEIREDVNKGIILPGITELPVCTAMETMVALARGTKNRVTGPTAMNQTSSRSHAVFTVIIAKESRTDNNGATISKLHLVDLAGAERIKKTKASGERLKEVVKINQGLLALSNVISALGDGTNRSFVSYRDSKLTRLLQDSLGGNSFTLMVACVSPADYNLNETVCTLRYADRARRINNKPVINQDAKDAEIFRLNNIVNELRLQLIGKLPTGAENTEQLELQLEKERNKYAELLKKHKQITEHLDNVLTENTNLCEICALLAEAARDNIAKNLNELTEQCNQTLKNLNASERPQDDEHQKTTVVDYIKQIQTRLKDLQSVNCKIDQDMINHEIKIALHNQSGQASKRGKDEGELVDDQTAEEEEKRAMGQVVLNKELQTLNREMAINASLIQNILADSKDMFENHKNMRESEEEIAHLEKERDELMQQLKQTETKDPTQEERLTKVSTLESEISDLKKRVQQQDEMQEKNEAKIASLNAELQTMKSAKVRIIKQMREQSKTSELRKWKADNERAMLKLKTEVRKRASAMAKMESLHAKQQNVLKRKIEETVAVNKRLKEALERQKVSQTKRYAKDNVKMGAVQAYIEQELDIHLSLAEAEKSLEQLMQYRAILTDQIEQLRNKSDGNVDQEENAKLEEDLVLRKAQISDLQQKILTADQEKKTGTQWQNIQVMQEPKTAIKCLFDTFVDAKRELQDQSEKVYQARYQEIKEAHDRLAQEFDNARSELQVQIDLVKMQSDQKLTELVALQRGVVGCNEHKEACKQLQNVIQTQQERLNDLEEENKKLVEELEQLRSANNNSRSRPKKKIYQFPVEYKTPKDQNITLTESEEAEDDQDPEWRSTPLFIRMERECVKADRGCGASGQNRRATSHSEDKENQPPSAEFTPNSTPISSFNKGNLGATSEKKRRGAFLPK